jgi:hypothetical protein
MSRNLDPTLAASLSAGVIRPVLFVQITFNSGTEYVWSGIGDFDFNGHTFSGVGNLGSIGPIAEGSAVKADGTSVTLSGIGLSQIGVPAPPVTPPAPPFPGQMAWAYPGGVDPGHDFTNPPSLGNGGLGCSGTVGVSSAVSADLEMRNGQSIGGPNSLLVTWGDFQMPPEIPVGATITGIYAVIACSGSAANCSAGVVGIGPLFVGPGAGSFSMDLTSHGGLANSLDAGIVNTLPGAATLSLAVSFAAMAVYYTGTPQTKMSLLQEALRDVRMGAPAKIWFGLMANGALIGTPYLTFSGTVDKPNVQMDEKTASITLALENRLVNLQRANQRRYTAADQKLAYPTDMAFNWVESLNDIALRWGS